MRIYAAGARSTRSQQKSMAAQKSGQEEDSPSLFVPSVVRSWGWLFGVGEGVLFHDVVDGAAEFEGDVVAQGEVLGGIGVFGQQGEVFVGAEGNLFVLGVLGRVLDGG